MDHSRLRAHNTAELLRLIWAEEGISRAELARRAGLSPSTVTVIVQELLDQELVYTSHTAKSRGGRPPVVLRFNDDRFGLVGVDIGASHVAAVVTNLRGKVPAFRSESFPAEHDPQGALALAERLVGEVVAESEVPEERVVGVGVAVPSPLDPADPDRLSERILPKWKDVRLKTELEQLLGKPVWVGNDANLGALAEYRWGAAFGAPDFVYIKVATGVGSGLIIGGEIYGGAWGIAGEIGHTSIDPDGPLCRCGLNGCLEALIGSRALSARLDALRGDTERKRDPIAVPVKLVEAAAAGDQHARTVIREAGHHLGVAVANLLNLLNPSKVVLGGSLTAAGDLLLEPLVATAVERALSTSVRGADIVLSELGGETTALGAATLVLEAVLAEPEILTAPPQFDSELLVESA